MLQKYDNLDDLWCSWGDAMSALTKHIKEKEPVKSNRGWSFEQAMITAKTDESYSLYVAHTAFDEDAGARVRLHVQAFASLDGEIEVKTNKREIISE
ncbi:MAG: hypothetical protein Alis3KO_05550 [Aliiglaciecola sp.]